MPAAASSSAVSSSSSSWFPHKFTFPNFSVSTQQEIANLQITKLTRINIIESLGHQMWAHTSFPTSSEYTEVCKTLVTKFPILTIGNGYGMIGISHCVQNPSHLRSFGMPVLQSHREVAVDTHPGKVQRYSSWF